jgi:hypothetical protein
MRACPVGESCTAFSFANTGKSSAQNLSQLGDPPSSEPLCPLTLTVLFRPACPKSSSRPQACATLTKIANTQSAIMKGVINFRRRLQKTAINPHLLIAHTLPIVLAIGLDIGQLAASRGNAHARLRRHLDHHG